MPGLTLTEILTDYHVAICSRTGAIISGSQSYSGSLLHKFSLQEDGSFCEDWKHPLPENIEHQCRKYLTDTGDIMLQNNEEGSTTFLFDQNMQLISSWESLGQLIAGLPGPRSVYVVKDRREEKEYLYRLDIKNQAGEILQLKPEGHTWTHSDLSVCEDTRTGKLMVVQSSTFHNSLDVFLQDGKFKL